MDEEQTPQLKRVRSLTQALLFSGTLNLALLGTTLYLSFREPASSEASIVSVVSAADLDAVAHVTSYFETMDRIQLIHKLGSRTKVASKYQERDLALALLVERQELDLNKALGGQLLDKVELRFEKGALRSALVTFPKLTDAQFLAIEQFAQTECWPMTVQGILQKLQEGGQEHPSLVAALIATPEFVCVEQLFSKLDVAVSKQDIVYLLAQGDWQLLSDFVENQKRSPDFSCAQRRLFLLNYLDQGSSQAAQLLVQADRSYLVDVLEDKSIVGLVALLKEPTPQVQQFLVDLLLAPRSTQVWTAVAEKLYRFEGEALPQPYNHIAVLTRFVPEELLRSNVASTQRQVATVATSPVHEEEIFVYQVQEGDSLWKLAMRHKTSVAKIKALNGLDGDQIRRGQKLKLPKGG